MIGYNQRRVKRTCKKPAFLKGLMLLTSLHVPMVIYAAKPSEQYHTLKDNLSQLFAPKSSDEFKVAKMQELSNFRLDRSRVQEFPTVQLNDRAASSYSNLPSRKMTLQEAVKIAIQRNPDISQAISTLAGQNAGIDVAKAGYYPQISGGITTGDLSSGERGRQLLTLNATQMLYDFGKVKSGVSVEKAKLQVEQANVLVSIDDIALDVAQSIINIQRYLQLNKIAEQQIAGIQRIQEIANLRANAGISSQADPIQAQSYLQAAQSGLIAQQSLLRQYQQHLRTLLGGDVSRTGWIISDDLVKVSDLYGEPEFNTIPKMIAAQAGIEVAKARKLMTIVPIDEQLLIEARILPRDIAFIRPGQEALVKITAYDYSIYGGLKGKVTVISPDTIRDEVKQDQFYYRVYIRTDSDKLYNKEGKAFGITPGMVATVDIRTGQKTLLDYLLKPFNKAKEALRER